MVVYACNYDASAEEYTLLVDKPKNCEGNRLILNFLILLLIQQSEYKLNTRFPDAPMDDIFQRRQNKNFYTVYWNVSLNIQENQMIWSVTLKLANGQQHVTIHKPRFLDAMETSSKILGSLADRVRPVKPRSDLPPKPVTPRKREGGGNAGISRRKSSRLSGYHSPREVECDTDFQPFLVDGDESDAESRSMSPEEDYYEVSD
jgi:hypothetical protein